MSSATISPKNLVVPKDILEEAGLKSGQKVVFIVKKGIIHIVPEIPLEKMVGFLKGMDISDYREHEDQD